nr:M20 family metallopeptidase [Sporosarcina sp. T2O-4]
MFELKRWIEQYIEEKKNDLTAISDFIWDHPEIRFEEVLSSQKIMDALQKEGFDVQHNLAGMPTAFVGEFGTEGPVIAFLGEYDALADLSQESGVAEQRPIAKGDYGHGCGHNLLGVGALGAAFAVKAYLEQNGLPGRVRYYGCPAEEGGSGKTFMARDGVFTDVDLALTWHPAPMNSVWSFSTLANIQAYFKFKGKSAHAAAAPHLGRSALDAVELMNVGVNYLREHMIDGARIHYAITDSGGHSPNVVQSNAEVLQLIRAPRIEQAQSLYERMTKIAEGAALMTGTEVEVVFDKACSNFIPNHTINTILGESMADIGPIPFTDEEQAQAREFQATFTKEDMGSGEMGMDGMKISADEPLVRKPLPYMKMDKVMPGSTDVGDVSWVAPTGQIVMTTAAFGTPLHTWQLVAQGKTSYAHKGMLQVSKVLALSALKMLHNEELIAQAKTELQEAVGETGYVSPIPEWIKPNQKNA